MKLNATIANLRLFNSGVYKDVTISFPTTTEKIHSALRKIAIDGRENKEILITQYETDIKGLAAHLGEYEDIDELNYLASRLAGFSPYEMAVFSAAVQHGEYSNSMQDLINLSYNLDCFTLYPDIMDAETYGRTLLEDIEELEIPEEVKPYIDYEAYGRDMRINEDGHYAPGGYVFNNNSSFIEHYSGRDDIPPEHRIFAYPKLNIREQMAAYQEIIDRSALNEDKQRLPISREDR